ncbi:hypothetical protein [Runella sp.]|uniref:hypothetical protein n=1 Tax=Runella sp. TaxID=1960881 RepID=UPI003D0C8681
MNKLENMKILHNNKLEKIKASGCWGSVLGGAVALAGAVAAASTGIGIPFAMAAGLVAVVSIHEDCHK